VCTNPIVKPEVRVFLKLIRYAEHYGNDGGSYYVTYGGGRFTDTSQHPFTGLPAITKWGKTSSAAGAYQIKMDTYNDLKANGIICDFSPCSQDTAAIELIKAKKAMDLVTSSQIQAAIEVLNRTWTALPGGKHSNMPMDTAVKLYEKFEREER
jgi:muramidase (phage lysozyme)